jgi:hypothetical protein
LDWQRHRAELLRRADALPEWARAAVEQTHDAPADITWETRTIDRSYIDFLHEMIELEPRGPEWTQLLKRRIEAYEPHLGIPLTRLLFPHGKRVLYACFDGDELIHAEDYELE